MFKSEVFTYFVEHAPVSGELSNLKLVASTKNIHYPGSNIQECIFSYDLLLTDIVDCRARPRLRPALLHIQDCDLGFNQVMQYIQRMPSTPARLIGSWKSMS